MSQENDRQLPDGWQWVKLGDICEIINGYAFKSSQFTTDGVPVIKMGNISKDFALKINLNQQSYIAKNIANLYQDFYIYPNDLLITLTDMSPSGEYLGTVAIYNLAKPALLNQRVGKFINLDQEILDNNFLYYTLRSKDFRKYATLDDTGNLQKNTNPKYLYEYLIPLPPLSEQKRIAAILNEQMEAVEKARKATEAQLEAAKALPAAYLRAVFESEEANSWERKPFGELVNNFDGQRVPITLNQRKKGTYPYYGASGIIDYVDGYLFDGEYLLIGEDGANLVLRSTPIAFKATGKFWVNNHAHVMQPKNIVTIDYLINFFAVTNLTTWITGAAQPKLSQAKLNSILVPVPPINIIKNITENLTEQMQEVERLKQNLKEQLDTINKLPAVLLRRAFKGEL